jgi:RND family efflux transporter MFP subunit
MATAAPSTIRLRFASIAGLLLLCACGQDNSYKPPPAAKVTVALPVQQTVRRHIETTGNTAAVNTANLVARVQGFLQGIHYTDGAQVKKGQKLFTIEPEPYRVKVEQAKAAEAAAQATLTQAEADLARQTDLYNRQIAAKATLESSTANRDGAKAKLAQAHADTETALINLSYTEVTAPFDGIVSARQVSIGELVGSSGSPTVLATIVQLDPIWVNFNLSEQDVIRIRAIVAQLGLTPADLRKTPVEIGLQTETGYPHSGTLDYAAPTINQSTGTLAVRAVFQNPKRELLPGYFVRVRVPGSEPHTALLVPDVALGSDQGGRYLLIVNNDNVVEQRKVEIGQLLDDMRVIEKGLSKDDRVVVAGILRAIPGQKVDPQLQSADASRPSAGGAK